VPALQQTASVVAIASLMAFVASFAISLGPIFWLLNAEIYPLGVRSKATGPGTMANWTFNFIFSLTFLRLIEALGRVAPSGSTPRSACGPRAHGRYP
jgi:hypothetical protein